MAATVFDPGSVYGPLVVVIWLGACYAINHYSISRARYSKTVSRLVEM